MAQYQNNDYSIIGTIYLLDYQSIPGKKDPSKTYSKYLVTLEVSKQKEYSRGEAGKGYKTYTEFPQFEAFNQDLSNFAVGDLVKINFSLSGKEYKKSDGSKGIFCKNILNYIRFSDIEGNSVSKPRTSTNANSNMADDYIELPDPHDDNEDNLPF
jgi:hypothetical protein